MFKKIIFLLSFLSVSFAWADGVQVFKNSGLTVKVYSEDSVKGNQYKVVITNSLKKRLYVHEWIGDAVTVKANFLDVNGDGLMDVILEDWFEDGSMSPTILVNDNNIHFANANPKNVTLELDGFLHENPKDASSDKTMKIVEKLYWVTKPDSSGKPKLVFDNLRFYDKKHDEMVSFPNVALTFDEKRGCFEVPAKYLKAAPGKK